jgi:hypothetical protein
VRRSPKTCGVTPSQPSPIEGEGFDEAKNQLSKLIDRADWPGARPGVLHRLKGEALLAGAGTVSEAEAALQQAIAVARRQNAKSSELRGAMSLARLRRQQGRPQEAVALLAPILAWFIEGFDAADLNAACTLLDDLEAEVCPPHLTPALSAP